ncbi:hypothetical protein P8452_08356 [Trifolium repens]|nr:hypothetical protein P8452_08356 [Trifolium repens]
MIPTMDKPLPLSKVSKHVSRRHDDWKNAMKDKSYFSCIDCNMVETGSLRKNYLSFWSTSSGKNEYWLFNCTCLEPYWLFLCRHQHY